MTLVTSAQIIMFIYKIIRHYRVSLRINMCSQDCNSNNKNYIQKKYK